MVRTIALKKDSDAVCWYCRKNQQEYKLYSCGTVFPICQKCLDAYFQDGSSHSMAVLI